MSDQEHTEVGQNLTTASQDAQPEHRPTAPPASEPNDPRRSQSFPTRFGSWKAKAFLLFFGGLFALVAAIAPLYVGSIDARYEASREVIAAAISAIDAQAGADDRAADACSAAIRLVGVLPHPGMLPVRLAIASC